MSAERDLRMSWRTHYVLVPRLLAVAFVLLFVVGGTVLLYLTSG